MEDYKTWSTKYDGETKDQAKARKYEENILMGLTEAMARQMAIFEVDMDWKCMGFSDEEPWPCTSTSAPTNSS